MSYEELYKAANAIREHCDKTCGCQDCPFLATYFGDNKCILFMNYPAYWDLHRMKRGDRK